MSTSHFIPEVWAASILENFRNKAVLTGLANRDYEGDLKAGNTVHIPGIVDIQVKDYKTGVVAKPGGGGTLPRTTAPDEVSDTGIEIKVDQEKSFDFIVDDIDAAFLECLGEAHGARHRVGPVTVTNHQDTSHREPPAGPASTARRM